MLRSTGLSLGLALLASPAFAGGGLTGAYAGALHCETATDSGVERDRFDSGFEIDVASDGDAFAVWKTTQTTFRLSVITPPGSVRSRVLGPACTFSPDTGGALLLAEGRLEEGSASLKGELLFLGVGGAPHGVLRCRFSMRRTSTELRAPISGCS